ncbi:hypothetical protein EHM76_04865 [bacterium]|nr:MAG: hypothetical protein EHM76_04865 [bacterium]
MIYLAFALLLVLGVFTLGYVARLLNESMPDEYEPDFDGDVDFSEFRSLHDGAPVFPLSHVRLVESPPVVVEFAKPLRPHPGLTSHDIMSNDDEGTAYAMCIECGGDGLVELEEDVVLCDRCEGTGWTIIFQGPDIDEEEIAAWSE